MTIGINIFRMPRMLIDNAEPENSLVDSETPLMIGKVSIKSMVVVCTLFKKMNPKTINPKKPIRYTGLKKTTVKDNTIPKNEIKIAVLCLSKVMMFEL